MQRAYSRRREERKRGFTAIAFLALLNASTYAQKTKPFTLLPDSAVHHVSHLCSRQGLPKVDGSWRPAKLDIELIESRLAAISRLRSKGEVNGVQIKQHAHYYRQYVAVIVGGHQLIYVNAFSDKFLPGHSPWRTRFVDVCDTGPDGWGALYDPATGSFSELRTNGILLPPAPPPIC